MTLITQKQLQEGLQNGLDDVTEFNSGATIEGDTLLDDSLDNLPFALIMTARDYELLPAMGRMVGSYTIPVIVFVEFVDWQESRKALRDVEQAVHNKFNEDQTMWAANGLSGVNLRSIRADDIGEVRPEGSDGQALPVFLTRTIDFEIELL